jgi:non-ribosomal peptide synthetase component E (peptide arylation enzyme)
LFDGPFFNEFAAAIPGLTAERYRELFKEGILLGLPLRDVLIRGLALPKESFLICATETLNYEQLEEAVKKLAWAIKHEGAGHAGIRS